MSTRNDRNGGMSSGDASMRKHSIWTMISYGFGRFIDEFMNVAFGLFVFFFYETEIGLNVWYASAGFIIYAVWNAVNDPLVGYLTDRPFRFTKRWGRRFPWIMIGGLGWVLTYVLLFTPPDLDPQSQGWLIFTYLVLVTCIHDTFSSLWSVNFFGLFPDKFRGQERKLASGVSTLVGFLGIATGSMVPPMFVEYGSQVSYVTQGLVLFLIGLVVIALSIQGSRDDKISVAHYLEKYKDTVSVSFFQAFKKAMQQRNFVLMVVMFFLEQTTTACLLSSSNYLIKYILNMEADTSTLIMAGFLLGALLSIPVWTFLAHKLNNNRKLMLIVGFSETLFITPLLWASTLPAAVASLFLFGIGFGGYAVVFRGLVFPDVIDESVVLLGERKEGIYVGIQAFFGRISFAAQALIFAVIHQLTGFQEGLLTQTPSAIWGIRIHLAGVPLLCILISALIFLKWYDLTPQRLREVQSRLEEMGV